MATQKYGHINRVLSRNVRNRMDERYSDLKTTTAKITALASEAGIGTTTIFRIIDPEQHGPHRTSINVVEALAKAFRCEPYELLMDRALKTAS